MVLNLSKTRCRLRGRSGAIVVAAITALAVGEGGGEQSAVAGPDPVPYPVYCVYAQPAGHPLPGVCVPKPV